PRRGTPRPGGIVLLLPRRGRARSLVRERIGIRPRLLTPGPGRRAGRREEHEPAVVLVRAGLEVRLDPGHRAVELERIRGGAVASKAVDRIPGIEMPEDAVELREIDVGHPRVAPD